MLSSAIQDVLSLGITPRKLGLLLSPRTGSGRLHGHRQWAEDEERAAPRCTRTASALLEMKLPVNVVSQRLGHKDASITPSIHTHAMKQYDEEAAAPFAALVMPRGC